MEPPILIDAIPVDAVTATTSFLSLSRRMISRSRTDFPVPLKEPYLGKKNDNTARITGSQRTCRAGKEERLSSQNGIKYALLLGGELHWALRNDIDWGYRPERSFSNIARRGRCVGGRGRSNLITMRKHANPGRSVHFWRHVSALSEKRFGIIRGWSRCDRHRRGVNDRLQIR